MAKAACAEGSSHMIAPYLSPEALSLLLPGLTAGSQPGRSFVPAAASLGCAQAAKSELLDVAATSHIAHTCAEAVHDLMTASDPSGSSTTTTSTIGGHQAQQQTVLKLPVAPGWSTGGSKQEQAVNSSNMSGGLAKRLPEVIIPRQPIQPDELTLQGTAAGSGQDPSGDLQASWLVCLQDIAVYCCSTTPEAAKWLAASSPFLRLLHALVAKAAAVEQATLCQSSPSPVKATLSAKFRRSSSNGTGKLRLGRGSSDDGEVEVEGKQPAGSSVAATAQGCKDSLCLVGGLLALRILRHLANCCLSTQMVPAERWVILDCFYCIIPSAIQQPLTSLHSVYPARTI
jgi:hypothetical protein